MIFVMPWIRGFLGALSLAIISSALAQSAPGGLKGGVAYTLPAWFKPSLLDIREDVEEARAQDRHLMLFLHLDECPYCARMLEENFTRGENHDFMRQHFDVVGLNVRGAQEVVWIDGKSYTEQALARHLKVFGTPTLVFLGQDGKVALQLSGYRDPRALRQALEYVQGRHYRSRAFPAWLKARDNPVTYVLRDHPQFNGSESLKGYRQPLAILFEDRQCAECARFHERTLNRPDVRAEMQKFRFVRLDADSSEPIVAPDGRATTPAQWAMALGFNNRPAFVLYDAGREVFRFDGLLYHFHFKETLRYVSGGHYKRYPTISQYNAARRAELREQGVDIDYGE
jgi:thioredoxin-related protein